MIMELMFALYVCNTEGLWDGVYDIYDMGEYLAKEMADISWVREANIFDQMLQIYPFSCTCLFQQPHSLDHSKILPRRP